MNSEETLATDEATEPSPSPVQQSATHERIRPGILVYDEWYGWKTIYPTGLEWLIGFALHGCKWAEVALDEYVRTAPERNAGEGI